MRIRHTAGRYLMILFLPITLGPLGVFGQAPAQDQVTTELKATANEYRSQRLQEKLFVHTDKELYLAGEICWFKLYVVEAGSHRPLDMSKVAYLEWLDAAGKPVLQTKTGLSAGHGDGSFYLPLSLRSGHYRLRAYTNWMKNYGPDWFFEKTLTVINARRAAEASTAETSPADTRHAAATAKTPTTAGRATNTPTTDSSMNYRIAFFPEGGNLVENLTSKIAFRITDRYGRGVDCGGVVTQDDQDTIVRCVPYKFGIGTFLLRPMTGHHYRAIFRLADGTAVQSLLPAAYEEGMVMSVSTEDSGRLRVNIQSSSDGSAIYLAVINRGSLQQVQTAVLQESKASLLIDKKVLGEGIAQLTLFNAARQPMCERLVFESPTRSLHLTLHTDKESYGTRKKIDLSVGAAGGNEQPLTADCSVSVFRVDSLGMGETAHINPWLWLSSDLKGTIESPGYYFQHPEDTQAMDNLLISHGWRKYRWEDQLHPAPLTLTYPPEYRGSIVSGRVVNSRTGAAATSPIQAYLSVPGGRTQFTSTLSDGEGRVRFELKDFYGGQEVIVQTNPLRDSNYRVEITPPFSETYADNTPLPPVTVPEADSGVLTDNGVAMQVLNRYVGERLKLSRVPAIADTTLFYDRPDYSYLLDNYVRFITMEEVMREYVVLMLVKHGEGHYHLPLFNLTYNQFFDDDPLILLDGVPIFNIDSLMVLDPLKIRKLQTVQRRVFMGPVNFPGIMNWTTYKGDLGGYILDPHATVVDYEGLQLQREFYSPSYETEAAITSHLPDFRTVLYWAPEVPMPAPGKGALSFYSSDLPGKYIVIAEGITRDGTAGSGMTSFEVK